MQITQRSLVFAARGEVVLQNAPRDLELPTDGAIIETRYSCISAGTEVAKLTGAQEFAFPGPIGNRAVGRVLEVGAACEGVQKGDLVFAHTPHASHASTRGLLVPLPNELDQPDAALLGMASVAITGLRVAQLELGDTAVVLGAGLVGQFTAQLLRLSGVRPLLIDRVPERLAIAASGGIETIIADEDAQNGVLGLTNGAGVECVFECTGNPRVALEAPLYAKIGGKIILAGSPRGTCETDATAFLNHFHLHRAHGDLTLQGAHEWKIPLRPTDGLKHSQTRNVQILADLMRCEQLPCAALVSQMFPPERAQEAYNLLIEAPQKSLGVVFDWTGDAT